MMDARVYYRGLPRPRFQPLCVCGKPVFLDQPLVVLQQGSYAHEVCAKRRGYKEHQ